MHSAGETGGTGQSFLALISTFLHSVIACHFKISDLCPQYETSHQSINQSIKTHKQCQNLLFWYFIISSSGGTRTAILCVLVFSGQD
jgi:hypothetical protein